MEVTSLLRRHHCLYLDTNLYIYFFEDNPHFATQVEEILNFAAEHQQTLIASQLLLTELLVGPYRQKTESLIQTYQNLPHTFPNLRLVDLGFAISCKAAELRAKYDIRTPDALHLATAIIEEADVFLSLDKQLKKVKEIEVLVLT